MTKDINIFFDTNKIFGFSFFSPKFYEKIILLRNIQTVNIFISDISLYEHKLR
jgi:hypothetical protein